MSPAFNLTDLPLIAAGLCLLAGAIGRRMVTLRALSLAGSLLLLLHGLLTSGILTGALGALLTVAHAWRLMQALRNPPGRSGRGSSPGGYRSQPLPIPTGDVERAPPLNKASVTPIRTATGGAQGQASRRVFEANHHA
jgi:hypothetical protein